MSNPPPADTFASTRTDEEYIYLVAWILSDTLQNSSAHARAEDRWFVYRNNREYRARQLLEARG